MPDMPENGFKTKMFGGFNKKQVLDYIDKMHAEFSESSLALQNDLKEAEKECKAIADSLQNSYNENLKLKQEINDLIEQKGKAVQVLASKDEEIADFKSQLKTATEQMEAMKLKCEKYDAIHTKVNDIMAQAKNMAAKIVNDAKIKADAIVEQANVKAEAIEKESSKSAAAISANMDDVAKDINAMKAGLSEMTKQIDKKISEIELILERSRKKSPAPKGEETGQTQDNDQEVIPDLEDFLDGDFFRTAAPN